MAKISTSSSITGKAIGGGNNTSISSSITDGNFNTTSTTIPNTTAINDVGVIVGEDGRVATNNSVNVVDNVGNVDNMNNVDNINNVVNTNEEKPTVSNVEVSNIQENSFVKKATPEDYIIPEEYNKFTHIAFADSANGEEGFELITTSNKPYIGIYKDNKIEDSTNPKDYQWTKIR